MTTARVSPRLDLKKTSTGLRGVRSVSPAVRASPAGLADTSLHATIADQSMLSGGTSAAAAAAFHRQQPLLPQQHKHQHTVVETDSSKVCVHFEQPIRILLTPLMMQASIVCSC